MKYRPPHCKTCTLRSNTLFSVLKGDQVDWLDREKTVREYQRGEVIFYESTPSFAVYCIHSGWAKLYKVGSRAERQVVRLLGPGDVIGHRAMLAGEPYSATAEVIETGNICTIPREPLIKMLQESAKLSLRFMAKLAQELRESEDQLLILSHKSVRQRTARLLLLLMKRSHENSGDKVILKIPLRRNEMAQMIGTTPESLSRALRYLAQRGIIRTSRTELHITQPTALESLAGTRTGQDAS